MQSQSREIKRNKIVGLICLLLSLVLTRCDKSGPLANCPRPNSIRVGSQIITNEETINQIVLKFVDAEKRWKHYWITLPNPEVNADFQKDGKQIASVFIGADWAIVKN